MTTVSFNQTIKSMMAWLNRLSGWILLLAIVWLCWNAARILWLMLAPPLSPSLPVLEQQPPPAITTNTNTALTLFQSEPSQPTAPQRPPPQVTLKGVMLAVPDNLSSAMLDVAGEVANYRIGKPIADTGYKLIEVSWDKVIIADDNDNQVVVDMPEPLNLNQSLNAGATASSGIGNRRLPGTNSSLLGSQSTDEQMGAFDNDSMMDADTEGDAMQSEEPDINDSINQATEALKQNPASYLSRMGVMATGEGYQVTDAMPAHIRDRLGLESGDRVLSVNGQNVGSNPSADADLLQQVKQSGEAQIEVQRGEQVISIRQQF